MIKGEYNLQDTAFVDCNFAYDDISNIIHEYMHHKLETSTILGIVNFMMEQTSDKNVIKISEFFKKVSLIVNENYAIFHQLALIKHCFNDKYNDFVDKFKRSEYYSTFYGKKILNIVDNNSIEELLSSNIINRIAFMSMNIDIYKLDKKELLNYKYIEIEFSKNEFNPNERYIKLLKTLEKLLKENNVKNITDDELLTQSGVEVIENNKNNFMKILDLYKMKFEEYGIDTKIINKNIYNVEQTDEENFILNNVTSEDTYNIFDVVRPMPLNENYEKIYPLKIEDIHFKCNVMKIMIANDDKVKLPDYVYAIVIFYDVVTGKQYIFYLSKESLSEVSDKFKNAIVIFYEDYNDIINNFQEIKNRTIFLEINNNYKVCKEFIENDMSTGREAMVHRLNNGVFFLFVKQKDGNVFVMYFFNQVINLIKNDLKEKFFNQVKIDKSAIDNCFYINSSDWCKYEDVIRSIAGTYIMDLKHKFEVLGYRTILE
ncbi:MULTISPECIES: hypothetical protein [unclassified Clostridium]|uniref:hypothetical protein n=1 Tax=unclassified Clostridium TaxID=2614128 RepID=UPI0013F6F71B|nr:MULTISPECIES: hypothetical protein [unclassified Clostridium]NFR85437.1 hypothetical protein [Clostridium botulinum]NFR90968.1 hypothetical protein [Clostridium botulinum]NFT99890.1 hypothetical protein [Clostridium botulinum]